MKYHGNNPVGMAIAADIKGEVRDQVLRILDDYRLAAEQSNSSSSLPATYRRNLAAAECAAVTLFPASNTKAPAADADGLTSARNSGKFLGVAVPSSSVSGLWLRVVLVAAVIAFALLLLSRIFRGTDKTRPVTSSGPRTLQPPQG